MVHVPMIYYWYNRILNLVMIFHTFSSVNANHFWMIYYSFNFGGKNQQYRISHWKLTRKFLKFRNNWHVTNDSYVYQYIITTEYTKNIKRLKYFQTFKKAGCVNKHLDTYNSRLNFLIVHRDVAHLSTCDDGCMALAELLGWKVNTGIFTCRSDVSFKSVTFFPS